MQKLWRLQIEWDEIIPELLLSNWKSTYSKFSHLNDLQIGQWTGIRADISHAELHGFADASTLAYAASVYLKVIYASGEVTVSLLAGKSKVAPISPFTIPRLELSAALLLVRLMNFVRSSLASKSIPCICWMDSTIVLTCLRSHPSRWKLFVANRVNEIQSRLPDAAWRHVPTLDNPADCASRGLCGDELLTHALWWQGPPWLRLSKEEWPEEPALHSTDAPVEEKTTVLHISETQIRWDLASRYSSWPRLIRITAYLFKIQPCRHRKDDLKLSYSQTHALSSVECCSAKIFWIKQIQAELFLDEIRMLANGQNVASKSSIAALRTFLDPDGVLRVGGRLRHAPLSYRVRHPILLASHLLIKLIALQAHLRGLHGVRNSL